mgnify:FL=1
MHGKCTGITGEVYEFISTNQQIHWFCLGCNSADGRIINDIMRLHDHITAIENHVERKHNEINKEIAKVAGQVEKQKDDVRKDMEKVKNMEKSL